MLQAIPIYRMLLQPSSFLPDNNPDKQIVNLVSELPNAKNQHRQKALSFIPVDTYEDFYLAHLLVETKIFIREMLFNCRIDSAPHQSVLVGRDIVAHFEIIQRFQATFFKYIVLKDLRRYNLLKGHMEAEVNEAITVEAMLKHIKKYGVITRLFQNLDREYQQLKNMY